MALRKSFKRRKNILEMFGNEHLIKWLHFLSYSKRAKKFTLRKNIITDFRLSRVLCDLHCVMNKSLTPYLHCKCLQRITAPQPPELIRRAVASFWSCFLRCIIKNRLTPSLFLTDNNNNNHLAVVKDITTGVIFDNRRYTKLSFIGTLSCDYASFPCHNVFFWKWFIAKCVECKLLLGL